jgi:hypothetical protein
MSEPQHDIAIDVPEGSTTISNTSDTDAEVTDHTGAKHSIAAGASVDVDDPTAAAWVAEGLARQVGNDKVKVESPYVKKEKADAEAAEKAATKSTAKASASTS